MRTSLNGIAEPAVPAAQAVPVENVDAAGGGDAEDEDTHYLDDEEENALRFYAETVIEGEGDRADDLMLEIDNCVGNEEIELLLVDRLDG